MNIIDLINKLEPIKTIYFLDRNIISIIKYYNLGNPENDYNKKEILNYLIKEVDHINSIITPIFSLFEGEHGRIESPIEIPITVNKEVRELKTFFKKARIDPFKKILNQFKTAKSCDEYIKKIEYKINFLKDINEYIYQPLSKDNKSNARNEIIKLYENKYKKYFDKFDPVVFSVLLCLYDNEICRRILKPKKDISKTNYYNAVMDLQHFSFFIDITRKLKNNNKNIYCKFLSGDNSLNEFFS